MQIAVIGGECASGGSAQRLAAGVGAELARRGVTVVCGGGLGVMEAACHGARENGGHTIGILPGNAAESPPNACIEFPVYTGLGAARNLVVVLSGEAVIAIDGSYGTLSEIAFALIYDKPLVGPDTWDFAYHGHDADRLVRATDPVDAVEKAIALVESRATNTK